MNREDALAAGYVPTQRPCENVSLPGGGTAIVCSRGAAKTGCKPGALAVTDPNGWRCPDCGRLADVYETSDGRMVVRKHLSRYA